MDEITPVVAYLGQESADTAHHDGRLRPVVGVQSVQVLRANRAHPAWADGWGWTYNHAPMLAYWRGRFYLSYLSDPVGEHTPPSHTLLVTSADGLHWGQPQVIFPEYALPQGSARVEGGYEVKPGDSAVMHQRMGFYVAPNDRLLALGFYGVCPHPTVAPNRGRGIGRVVREVHDDGSFGPLYFIRYNRHAGWDETNTNYPLYTASPSEGFREACQALLADRLVTLQWWEEDRSPDGFYAIEGGQALSYYHLPDGRVAALWKWARTALSADEGRTWSPMTEAPTLVMAGAKVWGQRTSDGRYALVYNPTPDNNHRWPLAIVTGDDGLRFDHLRRVNGVVPPRRYAGLYKDYGLQYVRGIVEGNGAPPDGGLWLTYSVNKEDIWVSRVPVPVRDRVEEPVHDTFTELATGGVITDWNVYSPRWAGVAVVDFPGPQDKSLELRDEDPCDHAQAERVFPESARVVIRLAVLARQADTGQLYLEVTDGRGMMAARVLFDRDGQIRARNGGSLEAVQPYTPGTWYHLCLALDTVTHRYTLAINDQPATPPARWLAAPVRSVERLVLRTGPAHREPTLDTNVAELGDLPGAEERVALSVYAVNYVLTTEHRRA